ncbi:zinc finger protein 628 isoform X2 [Myripristis murdjan]|uniref:zinc finger protein 628 isoform X2 n=1 Tax=Myripristis murdjan TaxID=586833 RepID=UPI001175D1CA|nr:zinc finger protein 628-like isoform X2 [Myripristis murdjan]
MAAVDPSESPKRQKSPVEEVETSGEQIEECSSKQESKTTSAISAQSPGEERQASVSDDGDCVGSRSEVSGDPGAGADTTTCNSLEKLAPSEKAAHNSGVSCSDQRGFDWSEPEEDGVHPPARKQETGNCEPSKDVEKPELQPDTLVEATSDADAEEMQQKTLNPDEKSAVKDTSNELVAAVDGVEDTEEDDGDGDDEDAGRGEEDDTFAKPRKWGLQCKECGKRFNRRETFNLHRHFHAHEDELTPLTCKECGLTFQHRSSLIKHRSEHKEKEEQVITPKKEPHTRDERSFRCAQCEKFFPTVDKLRDHNCNNIPDKPYHCPLCRQEFQFKVSITKHMQSHSLESIFTCQECYQNFPDSVALRFHQRCHAALKPYECPECGMVFKHYSVMEDHRRKHTENMRSHQCNICGKTFKYSSLLHQHQYLHTGQKPFRCPECGKKFAFAQNMKAHCRQHRLHENNSHSSTDQPSKQAPVSAHETVRGAGKENTNQTEESKRVFSCPLCPQTCYTPANLRAHMLIHEAETEKVDSRPRPVKDNATKNWEKGHTCPHCPSIFRDEASFYGHLLKVHKSIAHYLEKVTTAPVQKITPLSSDNLQGKWRNDNVNSKSYKCSECGKMFRHRSVLELHMRIHSKDKPYQCKVCGKRFRFSSYLQQHLIIHTGKKPHKCPDCGKDFAFLQNMKTHQKLHQEKPFRCTSCRKGYSDEAQLQHHMLSHNGEKPHKCDLCDKSFGLAYLLRDHMNTHTGERPHRCDECHKSFSWFSSLLVHQKIHARKRQGYSQYTSFPVSTRMRGRGSRGRRGARFAWAWPRSVAGSAMLTSQPPPPYQLPTLRDAELHRRAVQPLSPMLSSRLELQGRQPKEPWLSEVHPPPVQWKVDGGEVMPVPLSQQSQLPHLALQQTQFDSPSQPGLHQLHQRSPGWADNALISQSGPSSVQSVESSHLKESSLPAGVPKKSSPSVGSEIEQQRQSMPAAWSSTPASTALASTSSSQHEFTASSSYMDGAALWSVRPTPIAPTSQSSPNKSGQDLLLPRWSNAQVSTQKTGNEPSILPKKDDNRAWDLSNPQVISSTVTQPEKPWNGCEPQKQWASGLAGASTSAQIDQSNPMSVSTPVSHGVGSTLWDFQTPPGIPKTISPSEKLGSNQEFQLQQKQVSSGWANVQTSTQKVPISIQYEPRFPHGMGTAVWGFQTNPVGPQTLLTGQLKPGNGQELQHQPMALMSERPTMSQTLSLPQLAPRTEPHKLGARLPFAPERPLQCMICGCSLPRELDLQMHYLQHAQGEI